MKVKVKKGFIALLVMCMLLSMLPMMSVSAATPALDVITDVEFGTIQINGTVPDLANQQVAIVVMDPSYTGDFTTIFENEDLIVGLEQTVVDADGKFTQTIVLADALIAEGYRVFVNGDAYTTTAVFDEPYSVLAGEQITLPIILKNGTSFSGLKGILHYDEELWQFESIAGANGYLLQAMDNRFISITEDGMGVEDDNVIGNVILTAKADLEDEALTTVSFDVVSAYDESRVATDVRIASLKVNIFLSVIPGDVDLDNFVTLKDAILLLQYLSRNEELNARQLRAADVLKDGQVNTADAVVIMQMCL